MSSDAVRVYPDLLKALTIPSDTTVENLELNKKICNPVGNQKKELESNHTSSGYRNRRMALALNVCHAQYIDRKVKAKEKT